MRVVEQTPGQLTVEVDLGLFSQEAVFKWLYWCGGKFNADVQREPSGRSLRIVLTVLNADARTGDWGSLTADLRRSLIDFQTRQIVAEETKAIRELIVAKAFDALDPYPLPPPGELTDPVGFAPEDFDEPRGK